MRKRLEQKIRKRLRCLRRQHPTLIAALNTSTQAELMIALQAALLDPDAGWFDRGAAAKLLGMAGQDAAASLLDLFFSQSEERELWETALALEETADQSAVPQLITALDDRNPHRRHAAARALGWIWPVHRHARIALIRALSDHSQPQPVREEAAESLAYSRSREAIEPLIAVLAEPDVRLRFWAVFAIGSILQEHFDPRAAAALEGMLNDGEVPQGDWWSVGKEALAMLAISDPQRQDKLQVQVRRILRDPDGTPEDRRWAECYAR